MEKETILKEWNVDKINKGECWSEEELHEQNVAEMFEYGKEDVEEIAKEMGFDEFETDDMLEDYYNILNYGME
jgi:hypothetical protein